MNQDLIRMPYIALLQTSSCQVWTVTVFFLETLTTEWQLLTRMTRTVFANLSERHISRLKLDAKLISWNVYAFSKRVPAGECSTQQSQFMLVKAHRDPTGRAFKALCWGPVMTGHHGHQMDWSLVQIYQNGWCLSDSMGNSHHCWISKRNGHVMKHHCWIAHGDNMWNYVIFFSLFKDSKVGEYRYHPWWGGCSVQCHWYPISEGQDLCGFPHESGKSNE